MASYRPISVTMDVESTSTFLPNLNASLSRVTLLLGFSRPHLCNSQSDLKNIFEGPGSLAGVPAMIKGVANARRTRLLAISDIVQARNFDAEGPAQGMLFIRINLDPRKIPFSLSV